MFSRRTALPFSPNTGNRSDAGPVRLSPRRPSDRLRVSTFGHRPPLPAARPRIGAASDACNRGPSRLSVELRAPPLRSRASTSPLATRAHLRDSRSSPRVRNGPDIAHRARRMLPNLPSRPLSEARPSGLHGPALTPHSPRPVPLVDLPPGRGTTGQTLLVSVLKYIPTGHPETRPRPPRRMPVRSDIPLSNIALQRFPPKPKRPIPHSR